MRNMDGGSWLLRAVCVAAFAVLSVQGRMQASLLLLVLPLACACMRGQGDKITPTAMAACLALGVWQVFPTDVQPALFAWCAACAGMSWLAPRDIWRRGIAWLAVCAGCMLATLACLHMRYQGPLAAGLAETAAQWVDGRPDAATLLIRAYQNGLARLPAKLARVPAIQFGSTVVMTDETRLELLRSLRTTLELALTGSVAQLIGGWLALVPVLCTAVPDLIRRKMGGQGELPEIGKWHLPRGWGAAFGVLSLGILVRIGCGATAIGLAGSVCGGVFALVYGIQGAASMLAQGESRSALWRWVWPTAALLLCPEIFVVIGAIDQVVDPRQLRRTSEDE